jgi:hypothetical protein
MGNLPHSAHAIPIERGIVADNGKVLGLGLGNQHAIKGVLMWSGQETRPDGVLHRHRQFYEPRAT